MYPLTGLKHAQISLFYSPSTAEKAAGLKAVLASRPKHRRDVTMARRYCHPTSSPYKGSTINVSRVTTFRGLGLSLELK